MRLGISHAVPGGALISAGQTVKSEAFVKAGMQKLMSTAKRDYMAPPANESAKPMSCKEGKKEIGEADELQGKRRI